MALVEASAAKAVRDAKVGVSNKNWETNAREFNKDLTIEGTLTSSNREVETVEDSKIKTKDNSSSNNNRDAS